MTDQLASEDLFVAHDGTYLLSHSVGLPVRGARAAVAEYMDVWENQTTDAWPQWLEMIEQFRSSLASLIGGDRASVCPQSNVSSALTKILASVRHRFTEPTILLTEDAFPSLGYVCEHAGYVVRYISSADDALDPETWARHLEGVDVALITHVHSNTGELIPAAEIIAETHQRGVISIVDVAQSVGIVPIDVAAWNVDFIVGSCVKWLSGGPGAGWLWVRPELVGECRPLDVGWWSHESPFEFDIHRFRYAPDALRFWGGTPSVLPYVAAQHSIDGINSFGVDRIRAQNLMLSDRLIERLGDRVTSPHERSHRSGTCIVAAAPEAVERLAAAGIGVDHRLDGIRVSPHVHTTAADLDRLVELI